MGRTDSSTRPFAAQIQAFFAVYPVNPFVIDVPALTPQQGVDPKIAIADPSLGNLANPQSKSRIVFAVWNITA
jgi:hypothetical protein